MGRFAGGRLGLGLDFLADGEGIGRYGGIERDLLQDQPLNLHAVELERL